MTTKTITRAEAERQILDHARAIMDVYRKYYPEGDYLYTFITKDDVNIHNDCAYGGKDYDFPIMIQVENR